MNKYETNLDRAKASLLLLKGTQSFSDTDIDKGVINKEQVLEYTNVFLEIKAEIQRILTLSINNKQDANNIGG